MDSNVKEILKNRKDHNDAYNGKPMSGDINSPAITRGGHATQAFTSEQNDASPSANMSQWQPGMSRKSSVAGSATPNNIANPHKLGNDPNNYSSRLQAVAAVYSGNNSSGGPQQNKRKSSMKRSGSVHSRGSGGSEGKGSKGSAKNLLAA